MSLKHGQGVKTLLVEDDQLLAKTLRTVLSKYKIAHASTAKESIEYIKKIYFELFIIDIMLPDRDGKNGMDLCKAIRKSPNNNPIIIITGKSSINYKLGAFKTGADDYLCKPFNVLELKARIETLLKRTQTIRPQKIKYKNLVLDKHKKTIKNGENELTLRKKEFELLELFIKNPNTVFSRDNIIECIWEKFDINSNTVDVHIRNLRKVLSETGNIIKTVHGRGYKID